MRWRTGSTNYSSGAVNIVGSVPSLCVYDNGTTTCNRGHTITTPGFCFSQSVGSVNSGGTCTSDYVGSLFGTTHQYNEASAVGGAFGVLSFGGVDGFMEEVFRAYGVSTDEWLSVKSTQKQGAFDVVVSSEQASGGLSEVLRPYYLYSTFKTLSLDSGYVVRTGNSTSDFFQLDIYGAVSILHPSYYALAVQKDTKVIAEDVHETWIPTVTSGVGASVGTVNMLEGEENPVEICVGDLVAPSIENANPAQYSVLRDRSGLITFDVVDAIGGVDKSSVSITVSGSSTTQPEGMVVVSSGVAIAQASFTGNDSRYTLIYDPTSDWALNETVTITVTGTDQVPDDSEGVPFSCYTGDPNQFGYEWYFRVEDHNDLAVTIVAVADPEPPYVTGASPQQWLGGVSSTDDVSFYLLDDHAGVDLSSVFVYINNVAVVSYGVPVGTATTVTSVTGGYFIHYVNSSGFSFDSRVTVRIVAQDLYTVAPNVLDYTYFFDIVGTETISIENFSPPVGITLDPELVDIQVDVIDRVYDIDESGLYLSINGTTVPASEERLYGQRDLTTVSGYTTVTGSISNATMYGVYASGVTISGTTVVSGSGSIITGGYFGEGLLTDLSAPYDGTVSGIAISGTLVDGVLTSGTLSSALVSGVNWNGSYDSAELYGVNFSNFNSIYTGISGTIISGSYGYRLSYHPPNDFDYQGAINVLVHGTNLSTLAPVTLEQVYQLFHGYNVKVYDRTFKHGSRVNVYLGADNIESFKNRVDYGYYFETIDQPSNDMTASIVGIAPWEDLGADITPQAPVHRYGETVQVEVYVEDVEGNALGPYTFSYTIEEAPE